MAVIRSLAAPLSVLVLLSQPGPTVFIDETAKSEIAYRVNGSPTPKKYLPETMVGGVGLLDYDGDGRLDIYFVNGAKLRDGMTPGDRPDKRDSRFWNRLYRNLGNGKFEDVTAKAGVAGQSFGMGVAIADYDNDGKPDIYVTNYGSNILYHNDGNGKFSDVTERAAVGASGWSTGAAFLDLDNDGDLDLFVARYLDWQFQDLWCGGDKTKPDRRAYCHPNQFQAVPHLLYENKGDGTFVDISMASNIAAHPGKGLGVAINDYDGDGLIDILVANDSAPQQLFRNKGEGKFEEIGVAAGLAYDDDGNTFAGMGLDFADYDNDGRPDVFINALGNQRYALFNNRKDTFEYVSGSTGISRATMLHSGWGARFLDYDNDGWKDLFVAQGHVMDNIQLTQPALRYREKMLLLRNERGRFRDVSSEALNLQIPERAARGAAFGDLDNDGFQDVVVSCLGEDAVILRNRASGKHWLTVHPIGKRSNRDAIGVRVHITTKRGLHQYGIVSPAGSYLSSSDRRVHFGLGDETLITHLELSWPSGIVQQLTNIKADQILTVPEPDGTP